jgi:hypothetical protein
VRYRWLKRLFQEPCPSIQCHCLRRDCSNPPSQSLCGEQCLADAGDGNNNDAVLSILCIPTYVLDRHEDRGTHRTQPWGLGKASQLGSRRRAGQPRHWPVAATGRGPVAKTVGQAHGREEMPSEAGSSVRRRRPTPLAGNVGPLGPYHRGTYVLHLRAQSMHCHVEYLYTRNVSYWHSCRRRWGGPEYWSSQSNTRRVSRAYLHERFEPGSMGGRWGGTRLPIPYWKLAIRAPVLPTLMNGQVRTVC